MQHRSVPRWKVWPFPAVDAGPTSSPNTVPDPAPTSDPLAAYRAEKPDATGVRRGLVARVRQLIADGKYDHPDCWAAAEDQLFRHAEAGPG